MMRSRPILLSLALAAVCATVVQVSDAAPRATTRTASLVDRFNAAIADAAVYRHSHLRRLRPLTFEGPAGTALVTTLTEASYRLGQQRLREEIWVTGVPEVRRKCRAFRKNLALRLRQLLGLHPNTPISHFVTFTVRRRDVFRPAADPDPTTRWPCPNRRSSHCGLVFPEGTRASHFRWMANEMLSAWVVATSLSTDGYPWTRLGYTYDWHRGGDRYGASEYVVRPGSVVTVQSVVPYVDYCARAS